MSHPIFLGTMTDGTALRVYSAPLMLRVGEAPSCMRVRVEDGDKLIVARLLDRGSAVVARVNGRRYEAKDLMADDAVLVLAREAYRNEP